jgi:hypothetical protein
MLDIALFDLTFPTRMKSSEKFPYFFSDLQVHLCINCAFGNESTCLHVERCVPHHPFPSSSTSAVASALAALVRHKRKIEEDLSLAGKASKKAFSL